MDLKLRHGTETPIYAVAYEFIVAYTQYKRERILLAPKQMRVEFVRSALIVNSFSWV